MLPPNRSRRGRRDAPPCCKGSCGRRISLCGRSYLFGDAAKPQGRARAGLQAAAAPTSSARHRTAAGSVPRSCKSSFDRKATPRRRPGQFLDSDRRPLRRRRSNFTFAMFGMRIKTRCKRSINIERRCSCNRPTARLDNADCHAFFQTRDIFRSYQRRGVRGYGFPAIILSVNQDLPTAKSLR